MLVRLVDVVFNLFILLIIVRAVLSWIPGASGRYWEVNKFLRGLTEPLLEPFRRILPPRKTGGIDISPALAIIALGILRQVIVRLLLGWSAWT